MLEEALFFRVTDLLTVSAGRPSLGDRFGGGGKRLIRTLLYRVGRLL